MSKDVKEEKEEIWRPSTNIRQLSLTEDPRGFVSRLPTIIKDGLHHLWLGTKLLGLNMYTAGGLVLKSLRGRTLSRREKRLLVNTAADIFRLVPFSFFVIVPAAELTLPFFLKLFPNMLPSTFTSKDQEEEKLYKKVKARLEMAKFLLQTAESLKTQSSKFDKNFKGVLDDLKSGQPVSKEQVLKFVTMFKDDLTLANIRRSQIQAMCKFIGIRPIGPTDFLRGQISARIEALKTDDKLIKAEGISSLSLIELKQAVAARGMSSYGPRKQLEALMEEWLELSLNQKVPTALLILSRAYRMLPHQNPEELLRATLTKVPEKVISEAETEARFTSIDITPGVDPLQAKIELLQEEREKLKEEQRTEEASAKEIIGDITPIDIPVVSNAVAPGIVVDDIKKVIVASDVLDALANPVKDEKEDLQNLGAKLLEGEILQSRGKESASIPEALSGSLEKMEQKLKRMVQKIDNEIKEAEAKIIPSFDTDRDGIVTKEEMRAGLEKLGNLSPEDIEAIVAKLDADKDGVVRLDQITAVSHLEADILNIASNLVTEEEKKRMDTMREMVDDIMEEVKEKEEQNKREQPSMVNSDQDITQAEYQSDASPPEPEINAGVVDVSHISDLKKEDALAMLDKQVQLIKEVLSKEATAPPVSPLEHPHDLKVASGPLEEAKAIESEESVVVDVDLDSKESKKKSEKDISQ